jgi:hypothetical protein
MNIKRIVFVSVAAVVAGVVGMSLGLSAVILSNDAVTDNESETTDTTVASDTPTETTTTAE